jgi:hypothetical protein
MQHGTKRTVGGINIRRACQETFGVGAAAVRSWNGAKEAPPVILALIALTLLPLRSRLFEQG